MSNIKQLRPTLEKTPRIYDWQRAYEVCNALKAFDKEHGYRISGDGRTFKIAILDKDGTFSGWIS